MPHDSKYTLSSGVLKNKLGITDAKKLSTQEHIRSEARALELIDNRLIKPTFDLKYLQKIHEYLFQDIYAWAGQLRDVNIYKKNSFCDSRFIESEAAKLFSKLANDNYLVGHNKLDFSAKIAYYFGEINALHPFRDGNGRTQRIFIEELARNAGYKLNFEKISQNEMINASIEAWKGNYKLLEDMFNQIAILEPQKSKSKSHQREID